MSISKQEYKENIAIKSIFYFCSLPLRLDSYKGCTFKCLYCFSQCLNNRKGNFFLKSSINGNPTKLERNLVHSLFESTKVGAVQSCLQRRVPIHLGSVSDPFQHAETKDRVTLSYLKILSKFQYPTVISTKGTLVSNPIYRNILNEFPAIVQNSFSTLSVDLAQRIEPYAPSPIERLRSLEILAKAGIWTSVRLQPFLYPLIKPDDIDFKTFANAGVKHVVIEHLRIPTNTPKGNRERLFQALGMDILEEYRKIGIKKARINYELDSEVKLRNIIKLRDLVKTNGMSFGSADNDFHHISDTPCCCGLPDDIKFQNYYKGHIGYSLFESMSKGNICFNNIDKEWQPMGSVSEYMNSDCRKMGMKTVTEFLKSKISDPSSSNSPSSFAGINYDNQTGYQIDEDFRTRFIFQERKENDK